jgi:hypothetical protein
MARFQTPKMLAVNTYARCAKSSCNRANHKLCRIIALVCTNEDSRYGPPHKAGKSRARVGGKFYLPEQLKRRENQLYPYKVKMVLITWRKHDLH